MPIKYEELMALKNLGQKYAYSDREVMLYAYGIGMGADPMDENELAFVNEAAAVPRPLKVVPTFASVAAWGAGPGEMNLNRVMAVDGENLHDTDNDRKPARAVPFLQNDDLLIGSLIDDDARQFHFHFHGVSSIDQLSSSPRCLSIARRCS